MRSMLRIGIVKLTEANRKNSSLNLTNIWGMFPESAVGGSSRHSQAYKLLEIHYGGDKPELTDLAGDKKQFRKRKWIGAFLKMHKLKRNDSVVVERTGPARYHVYPQRDLK